MFITHSYLGAALGNFRCLFFLLIEDYIEEQTQFMKELYLYIEKFARDLKESAPLWRPFKGDIETIRDEFLRKDWPFHQRHEVEKTPAVLMINVDFKEFDPQIHPWFHFNFGDRFREGLPGAYKVGDILNRLAEIVRDSEQDIFQSANLLKNEIKLSDAARVFEAKPGIMGFSIDLIKSSDLVLKAFKRLSQKKGHDLSNKANSADAKSRAR
jgi:hypothetical protein